MEDDNYIIVSMYPHTYAITCTDTQSLFASRERERERQRDGKRVSEGERVLCLKYLLCGVLWQEESLPLISAEGLEGRGREEMNFSLGLEGRGREEMNFSLGLEGGGREEMDFFF